MGLGTSTTPSLIACSRLPLYPSNSGMFNGKPDVPGVLPSDNPVFMATIHSDVESLASEEIEMYEDADEEQMRYDVRL